MPVNANPLTPAERARIDELLASGMSQKKISKEVRKAQSTISLHTKRMGQTPVHRTPTEANREAHRTLYRGPYRAHSRAYE